MIFILGCNHGIQPGQSALTALDPEAMNQQRDHFRALIETIVSDNAIGFIAEEWGDVEQTAASMIASNRKTRWTDINTSEAEKTQMGIPLDYAQGGYEKQQVENWHRQREEFMCDKIKQHRGKSENILVICGSSHLTSLSQFLSQEGEKIVAKDFNQFDWYVAGVFGG
jgi:hypothetical protein